MRWCAFDIEGDVGEKGWLSAAVASDRGSFFFEAPDPFLECLREHAREGYTIVAHNAWYDVAVGLWELGEPVTCYFYNEKFMRASWRFGPGKRAAEIWDSKNLTSGLALSAVGDALGLPKLSTPQRLTGVDPDRYAWTCETHGRGECLECYNTRDAEITLKYMDLFTSFCAAYLIEPARTLGGTAVRLWKVLDPDANPRLRSKRVAELGRDAYHGGRCEVFQVGTVSPVHTYDMTGFYTAIASTAPMPDLEHLAYSEGELHNVGWEGLEGVVEAEVTVPDCHVPVLCTSQSGRLYFPVGRVRDCWTVAELRAAIARGAEVRRVFRMAASRRHVFPFAGFAGQLWAHRQNLKAERSPLEVVAKGLSNALYGRLGMGLEQEAREYRRRPPGATPGELEGWRTHRLDGRLIDHRARHLRRLSAVSNVLWAAQITGHGRLRLLAHLEAAGDSLVYCDTDGLFTTKPLREGEGGLGELRDTGTYATGQFLAPQFYRLEGLEGREKVNARGVPREVMARYLKDREVSFRTAVTITDGWNHWMVPGSWRQVLRRFGSLPTMRHVERTAALYVEGVSSPTSPVTFDTSGAAFEAGRDPARATAKS